MRSGLIIGGFAAMLLGGAAFAQAPAPAPAGPEGENPLVGEAAATHTADLTAGEGAAEGDATVTAWFRLDPQNNTLDWTIDVGEFDAQAIYIFCGEAPPEGEAPALNLVDDRGMGSAIEGTIGLSEDVFAQIGDGECTVVAETGGEAGMRIQGTIEAVVADAADGPAGGAPAGNAPAGDAPAGGGGAGGGGGGGM